jgi:hypothetical protein
MKPGFEKRRDLTEATESVHIERWTPAQVDAAREFYGREPSGAELRAFAEPDHQHQI